MPISDELTVEAIRRLLQLERNATCGFVWVTFGSKQLIATGRLSAPFTEQRPLGSALYFMVTPGTPVPNAKPSPGSSTSWIAAASSVKDAFGP
jgi:uncharacterized protein